jgi:hypothetical protein
MAELNAKNALILSDREKQLAELLAKIEDLTREKVTFQIRK